MSKLVVTGGRQRKRTLGVKEWSRYEQGVVLILDVETGQLVSEHTYNSPGEFTPVETDRSILFKSGSVVGNRLYVCTQTEVIIYRLPEFEQEAHLSLNCFNDVHHVVPTDRDSLLVVSTGLDLVLEISMDGTVLKEWFTVESSDWQRFSKSVDYRKVLSTKPHHSHPNFVFEHNGDIWATRFEQKDAFCLTGSGQIDIGIERPHDGHILDNSVYFTTVDGHIVEGDMSTHCVRRKISLKPYFDERRLLGWCRGLYPVNHDNFVVGFSRVRASAFHRNLIWAKEWLKNGEFTESLPTRIAYVDTHNQKTTWVYDVEDFGLNAVFSVHLI